MNRPISANGLLAMLTVAECGSINSAAEVLHVSQPALTRTVREFEGRLGERVFERGSKGVALTPLGKTLMEHARVVRSEIRQAQSNVDRFRRDRRLAIRLGAVSVQPVLPFTQSILDVAREHPDAHISLVTGTEEAMLHLLNEGAIEMVFGRILNRSDHPHVKQDVLYYDEAGIYCRADHPMARLEAIEMADLASAGWVLGPPSSMMRSRVAELLSGQDLDLKLALEVEDVPMRRVIVMESDLLSAFQVHHVHNEVRRGAMKRLPVELGHGSHPIGAIRLAEHSAFSQKLLRILLAKYRSAGLVVPGADGADAPHA